MIGESIEFYEVITGQELLEAWNWLLNKVQVRPLLPGVICYFDNKCWGDDPTLPNYEEELENICIMLGRLYIASQFGDHRNLIELAHGMQARGILLIVGNLDHDIRTVITSITRFRNHLSEHLSYWIRLAIEKKQRGATYQPQHTEFSCSRPNIQPEDKGPDGLYIEIAPEYKLEVISVKNSIRSPRNLIASSSFRRSGNPTLKKLLDDFWLLHHKNDGLLRLEDLLDQTLTPIDANTTQQLRLGLIKTCACNAVIVADTQYANETLFSGYEYVTPEIAKRIATYIGAVNWRTLAANTNQVVIEILRSFGIL